LNLTPAAVRKQIAAGTVDPLYLIIGEDDVEKSGLAGAFADLVDEGLRAFNVERLHASDLTSGDKLVNFSASVVDAVRTLPMMSPRRIVEVFQAENLLMPKRESEAAARALEQLEALFASPDPQTTLVLVSAPLDKRTRMFKLLAKTATVVECGVLSDVAEAQHWIRARVAQQGMEIDPAAARIMAELAGFPQQARDRGPAGNTPRLRSEVDRLLLYALGQKRITVDDVRAVAGPAALQDDWAMTNAIETGQPGEALRQLAMVLEAGAPPEKVLGQLGWVVRAKFPQIAPADVRPAIEAVFRTDVDLKRSAADPRILLERLIVELCAGKRARAGARRW